VINSDYFSWPNIPEKDIEKIGSILRSGGIYLKENILIDFEKQLCKYFQVKHALLTCNGTSAAFSCFYAIGLKPGDEIIGPSFAHWATVLPAVQLGCKVVFADMEADSFNISVDDILKKITPSTRAIVVCHMYGNPANLRDIKKICKRHNLFLIEDISHSTGALFNGKPVGSFGDVSFFSMQSNKLISGNEGGVLLTNNTGFYTQAMLVGQPKRLYHLSKKWKKFEGVSLGFKFRISPILALLAFESFKRLDAQNSIRREMFLSFKDLIKNNNKIIFPKEHTCAKRVWWEYDLLLQCKKSTIPKIINELNKVGIPADKNKFSFLPKLPQFNVKNYNSDDYPNSLKKINKILVLAPFKKMDLRIMKKYTNIVNRILENKDLE